EPNSLRPRIAPPDQAIFELLSPDTRRPVGTIFRHAAAPGLGYAGFALAAQWFAVPREPLVANQGTLILSERDSVRKRDCSRLLFYYDTFTAGERRLTVTIDAAEGPTLQPPRIEYDIVSSYDGSAPIQIRPAATATWSCHHLSAPQWEAEKTSM